MRIAIVSDIHGNLTAFEAVVEDLRETSPDLILHGGDLADTGTSPVEVVDGILDLGWPGIAGNTDEMLFRPDSLAEFSRQSSGFRPLLPMIAAIAEKARERLGEDRLSWLRSLPRVHFHEGLALVHGSPENLWSAPSAEAQDAELERVYGSFARPIAVYAHIHRPYIRCFSELTVANTGSVGLSYDGDCRAAYLLLDEEKAQIQRLAYDIEKELKALATSGLPHAGWVARMIRSAAPQMP